MTGEKITILRNGPYLVTGGVPLVREYIISDDEGIAVRWEKGDAFPRQERYILCRCGRSQTMPYCDGTHARTGFDGTETAGRLAYREQAATFKGPGLVMTDAIKLCAIARFCERAGDAWTLVERSADPAARDTAFQEIRDCPSGRLAAWDKDSGAPREPVFAPSISVVEDRYKQCRGPLWVKGGIPVVSAAGTLYEVRNRVTLCRCGRSANMPFCDGKHIAYAKIPEAGRQD
jgi:CDGSH-type Zn-finger protein